MPLGTKVAELLVGVGVDLKDFNKGMKGLEKRFQTVGKRLKSVGRGLTLGVTAPLLALGAASIRNFDKQAKALAKVEAGLKSMGTVGVGTLDDLARKASELQNKTLFGDEEILDGVTAQMLTFGRITGEQFDRAQMAAIDLSAKLGTDLKSSAIQVGKALNDPTTGLSMLTRVGITFTEEQKNLIKSLQAGGREAEAQSVILAELERQFGGTAEAMSKVGAGPLIQLKNRMGDLTEKLGEALMPALESVMGAMESLVGWFEDLSDGQANTVLAIGAIAFALGPLAGVLGLIASSLATIGVLATALGPIIVVVGGMAAIKSLPGFGRQPGPTGPHVGPGTPDPLTSTNPFARAGASAADLVPSGQIAKIRGFIDGLAAPPAGSGGGGGGGGGDGPPWVADYVEGLEKAAVASLGVVGNLDAANEPAMVLRQTTQVVSESWEMMREAILGVNERVRVLGTEMRLGMADTLGDALGQLATLQTGFVGFIESVVQGLRRQLAEMIALIAKQKILNALKAQESMFSSSGGLLGALGAFGMGNPLVGLGVAVGGIALGKYLSSRGNNQQQLSAARLPGGDIAISANSGNRRHARLAR